MAATQIVPNTGTQFTSTFTADAAIAGSSQTPLLVYLSAEMNVTGAPTTSTTECIGTVIDSVADGEPVTVYLFGPIMQMTAGETIAMDEWVCPSAVTAGYVDDADTTGDYICGKALQAAVVGEQMAVLVVGAAILAL